MKEIKPKRLLSALFLVVIVSVLIFSGCGKNTQTPASTTTAAQTSATALTQTSAQTDVITWKYQAFIPSNVPGLYEITKGFTDWLEFISDGRLKIDYYEPGAICSAEQIMNAVSQGTLDAGFGWASYWAGEMPEAFIENGLPMGVVNLQEQYHAWYELGLNDVLKEAYAERNIYFMPLVSDSAYGVGFNVDASGLADLKGKKVEATGIYGDFAKELGMSPTPLPMEEVYMALKLGTIDGYFMGPNSLFAPNNYGELTKVYFRSPSIASLGGNRLINMKSWNALPADLREKIETLWPAENLRVSTLTYLSDYIEFPKNAKTQTPNVELKTWSDEDVATMRQVALKVWEQVAAKNARCNKGVEILKQSLRDFGALD